MTQFSFAKIRSRITGLSSCSADDALVRQVAREATVALLGPSARNKRMNRGTSKGAFLSVSGSLRLAPGFMISALAGSTHGQAFGIITTHIDGSGQTVYFDDLTCTIATLPVLTIAKSAPAEVLLQWPTNYPGFTLESVLTLGAGSLWSPITNGITVNGDVYSLSRSTTSAAGFFRLRRP